MTTTHTERAHDRLSRRSTAAPQIPTVVWSGPQVVVMSWCLGYPRASCRPSLRLLRGLGWQLWRGTDAQAYVDRLRDEWDR